MVDSKLFNALLYDSRISLAPLVLYGVHEKVDEGERSRGSLRWGAEATSYLEVLQMVYHVAGQQFSI